MSAASYLAAAAAAAAVSPVHGLGKTCVRGPSAIPSSKDDAQLAIDRSFFVINVRNAPPSTVDFWHL